MPRSMGKNLKLNNLLLLLMRKINLKINNAVTAYHNYLFHYSSLDARFSRVLTHLTSREIPLLLPNLATLKEVSSWNRVSAPKTQKLIWNHTPSYHTTTGLSLTQRYKHALHALLSVFCHILTIFEISIFHICILLRCVWVFVLFFSILS